MDCYVTQVILTQDSQDNSYPVYLKSATSGSQPHRCDSPAVITIQTFLYVNNVHIVSNLMLCDLPTAKHIHITGLAMLKREIKIYYLLIVIIIIIIICKFVYIPATQNATIQLQLTKGFTSHHDRSNIKCSTKDLHLQHRYKSNILNLQPIQAQNGQQMFLVHPSNLHHPLTLEEECE